MSPGRYAEFMELLPDVPHDLIPHTELKRAAREVRAVIRSGDFTPYANIMLVAGVVYS